MIEEDEEELYYRRRDEIEYIGLFSNHKAVERIVKSRNSTNISENTDGAVVSSGSNEEFAKLVSQRLGKALDSKSFERKPG